MHSAVVKTMLAQLTQHSTHLSAVKCIMLQHRVDTEVELFYHVSFHVCDLVGNHLAGKECIAGIGLLLLWLISLLSSKPS